MADSYVVHSVAPEPFRLRLLQGLVRVARSPGDNRGSGVWGVSVTTGDSPAAETIERLDPTWQGQSVELLDEKPEWRDD